MLWFRPASVLAAPVLPCVVSPEGHGDFVLNNPQVPAAIIATAVAWFTLSTLLTLGGGMAALWLFKYLLG